MKKGKQASPLTHCPNCSDMHGFFTHALLPETCNVKWLNRKQSQSAVSLYGSLKAVNILGAWCVEGYLAVEHWVQTHLSSKPDYWAKAEGFPVPVS